MKNVVYILLISLLITGCSVLGQGWKNFNAYYNTFYNAKKFYSEGEREIKQQQPDVSQLELIRIFPEPVNTGSENFEQAINRGSGILRNHEDSKFVNRAILIIGKSYFYRSEFFSALEKFRELEVLSEGELQQEAIFWQGRTYFQLNSNAQGISVLENRVSSFNNPGSETEYSIYAILGQLYASSQNWSSAATYLETASNGFEDGEVRARTFYLLGQVYEELGENGSALYAYSRSNEISTDFDLEYNALYKEADVSRRIGSFPRAESIYRSMLRDDKYFEIYNELQYEIARTEQMRGNTDRAIQNYKSVLGSRIQTIQPVTKAKVYFSLAQIYRDQVGDYAMAAAYFDSASTQRVSESDIPFEFNAEEMADVFGRYAELRNEIAERDSLLGLSEMDADELDRFIKDQQRIEAQRIQEELDEIQSQRNSMLVTPDVDEIIESTETLENGFLNSNNDVLLADASLQFQAIWGDRPLADNWRRAETVSGSRFDTAALDEDNEREGMIITSDTTPGAGIQPKVDLSNIPFTEDQKQERRKEIEGFHYQLGNLFFLSLNQPDSAKVYFEKVTDTNYNSEFTAMSLYSLAEIALLEDNSEQANIYFEQLNEIKPNSLFTNRLSDRLGRSRNSEYEDVEQETSVTEQLNNIIEQEDSNSAGNALKSAETIRELAERTDDTELRAQILFQSARKYMQIARVQMSDERIIEQWFQRKKEINDKELEFMALRDSARVMVNDSTITDEQRDEWSAISDSVFTAPELTDEFPFEGAYWDSARSLLTRVLESSPGAPTRKSATTLLSSIEPPETVQDSTISIENRDFEEEASQQTPATDPDPILCEEAGLIPDVEGGVEGFMSRVTFPEWTQNLSMRGEVSYILTVNNDGRIEDFTQISGMDRSGIPQAIEANLINEFQFLPVESEENIRCKYIFPINL